jgi:hypothetical protein
LFGSALSDRSAFEINDSPDFVSIRTGLIPEVSSIDYISSYRKAPEIEYLAGKQIRYRR